MSPVSMILLVLACTTMAGLVTYFLNVSRERLVVLGQKSEELYYSVEALDIELTQFFTSQYSLLGKALSSEDFESLYRARLHLAKSRMLVGLYFPMMAPHLASVSSGTATAQRRLEALLHATEPEHGDFVELLDNAVTDLKETILALKSAILNRGKSLNRKNLLGLSRRTSLQIG